MSDSFKDIVGRHLVADLNGIADEDLKDSMAVQDLLRTALEETQHVILDVCVHQFEGGGFTLVFLLAESHLSVHTYPEKGYLAFDLFSCGAHDPRVVLERLAVMLQPKARHDRMLLRKG